MKPDYTTELAKEMNYKLGKTCHLSEDGGIIEII